MKPTKQSVEFKINQLADINLSVPIILTGTLTSSGDVTLSGTVNINLPEYADNAAAISGGLSTNDLYCTPGGVVMVVLGT